MFTVQTDAERIILTHENRSRAEIYLFGGLPNRYEVRREDGTWFNCIAAFDSPQQAQENLINGFRSAKLSPYVCRMYRGEYEFEGRKHRCSKHSLNGHAIHGLMYDAMFETVAHGADEAAAWVELAADYAQDDAGFPFAYRMTIRYRLDADGLSIATTVENTGSSAIPLADGWHPYFTLGGTADDWTLHINSGTQLEFDTDLLPTGKTLADTRFQTASSLKGIELDNSFVPNDFTQAACTLASADWRLSLYPDESYPYLQIYIPPERDSIAIENLSGAPDCFNNGLGLLVLEAGGSKRFETRYVLAAV